MKNGFDISRIGFDSISSQAYHDPLSFSHKGHRSKINDFNWSSQDPNLIVSLEDKSTL